MNIEKRIEHSIDGAKESLDLRLKELEVFASVGDYKECVKLVQKIHSHIIWLATATEILENKP